MCKGYVTGYSGFPESFIDFVMISLFWANFFDFDIKEINIYYFSLIVDIFLETKAPLTVIA